MSATMQTQAFPILITSADDEILRDLVTALEVAIRYGPDVSTDDPISWSHVRIALKLAKLLQA